MLCLQALEGACDIRTQAEQQTGNHFVSDELYRAKKPQNWHIIRDFWDQLPQFV